MSFVYFVLCAYGLTQIITFSSLFDRFRPEHHFFHCPMCVGFWAGVLLLILNPFTELFTFDVSIVNALMLGCLSSGTSYALCMLISDGGFQIESRVSRGVDTKMDAKTSNQLLQG
jgi:hypothetical protein